MKKNLFNSSFKRWYKILPFLLLMLIFIIIPSIILIVISFIPANDNLLEDNWNWLGNFVWEKIIISFLIAIAVTIISFFIGIPFSIFLAQIKSNLYKTIIVIILTTPMWLSMLIKIIGIKTLFDNIYGFPNATFGHIFTIITLVYLNLPIFILSVFNIIETMPKNLLLASKDLGRNYFQTLIYVIIPYILPGIIAGMFLVFLPSLTATGITAFVNNSNDGSLIGDWIFDLGLDSSSNQLALARISSISLIISLIILFLFLFFYYLPKKIIKKMNRRT